MTDSNFFFANKIGLVRSLHRCLIVALLAVPSISSAQTVSVGRFGRLVPHLFDGQLVTIVDIQDGATQDGMVDTARFAWSAGPCPATVIIRFFHPRLVAPGDVSYDLLTERGPFEVPGSGESVIQTVRLDPPIAIRQGDVVGLLNASGCQGPVATVAAPTGPPVVTAISRPIDVRSFSGQPDSFPVAVQATGPVTSTGSQWVAVGPPGLSQNATLTVAAPPWGPGSVWATVDSRAYESPDRGLTWAPLDRIAGDPASQLLAVYQFAFDPTSKGTAYAATASPSPESVLRTTDGGQTWSGVGPTPTTGPGSNAVSLVVDPADPRTLYFANSWCFLSVCHGGLFRSTDAAVTWSDIDPPFFFVQALAVDPANHARIYASTMGLPNPTILFRSDDGGSSWTPLRGYSGLDVAQLAVVPGSPSTVFAVAVDGRLWRSTDAGATWTESSYGIPFGTPVTAFLVVPATLTSATTLYLGTTQGVYWSGDGGIWFPLRRATESFGVTSLAFDGVTRTLYAGTSASGVWRLFLAEKGGTCSATSTLLCLNESRFDARVTWTTPDGASGAGQIFPISTDTGAFWFFSPNNLELVVKLVDGRAINGHFWVFAGALTNVAYTLHIFDHRTGTSWEWENPQGTLSSFADTSSLGP